MTPGTRVSVKRYSKYLVALVSALMLMAPPAFAGSGGSAGAVALPGANAHVQLARFGGGSRGFGRSRGFGSRNRGYGYGRNRGRGRGIFRSIIRALAVGYLLHLLFTTPGGNIVLLFLLAGIVMLFLRFRRRRTAFRY